LIGIVYGDYFYLTDVIYTQDGVEITQPMVAQLIIDTECLEMTIESNFGGSSYSRMIQMLLDQEGSKCQIIDKYNSQNKETRMIMRSGQVKKYMFFRKDFEHGSDYHLFMTHLTSYVKAGRNKHDDAPDAIAGLTEEWMDTQGITFLT
jgi:predicted phage terminase large subunit-like protein